MLTRPITLDGTPGHESEQILANLPERVFLVLAAAALRGWLSKPETAAGTVTNLEPEAPGIVAPQRPGVRFQPAVRSAFARIPNQPAPRSQEKLYVEWKGTWYPAEILNPCIASRNLYACRLQ